MKKYLICLATALLTLAFTACEDVPAPYGVNDGTLPPEPGTVVEPAGDGTLENPFNVVAALQYISSLETTESDKDVYIKGKVSSIKENYGTQFGNGTFYISDDGSETNQFYVFRINYLENKKYAEGDLVQVGDEVIICGRVTNYMGNTPETVQNKAYLYSLNGKTGMSGSGSEAQPTGDGTEANPFNSVAANQCASALESGAVSEQDYYIKGKVVSVRDSYNNPYGNASFYISDDGKADNQFYVFRALYFNNEKYTEGDLVEVGDEVVICGKLTNYMGNTPETVAGKAYLVSLKKGEGNNNNPGGGNENPGGELDPITKNSLTVAAADLGIPDKEAATNLTLSDGTTLSFDGGGNNNVPKYYLTGTNLRMYPKNSMTVESAGKQIVAIRLVCDNSNGTIYNASGDVSAEPGSVNTADEVITITDINALKTVLTNVSATTGAPSQLRIKTIIIYYAE